MKHKKKAMAKKLALYIFVTIFISGILLPFVWLILASFKNQKELFTTPLQLLPEQWNLDNYIKVFEAQPFGQYILNSVEVALAVTVVVIIVACMSSYSLARVAIRGKKLVLLALLSITLLPPVTLLNPIYLQLRALNMLNTWWGLAIAISAIELPTAVWFLNSYFEAIPIEMEESAVVDGCSMWKLFSKILIPLLSPGIFTVGILVFINAWNNYLFAQVFNPLPRARTVTVALTLLRINEHSIPWELISAAAVIVTLPLVVAVLFLQKRIISGMMDGGIKG